TDSDLGYKLPGDNPTLGEFRREIGDIEDSYTHIGYRFSFLKSWNFNESKLTSANWCVVSVSARHVSIARLKSAKFSYYLAYKHCLRRKRQRRSIRLRFGAYGGKNTNSMLSFAAFA